LRKFGEGLEQKEIDARLPVPLYHQTYLVLRNQILNGTYPNDSFLPGEEETAETFGVSRITAKRALNELANNGLVVREPGRGTRVIYQESPSPLQASIDGMLENLLDMGLRTQVELLSFGYVEADDEIAQILKCEKGADAQHAIRVRRLEGELFSYLTTFVPSDIGRSYNREDLSTQPLLKLLERSGVVIGRADQKISATLSDAKVSRALELDVGSPLLRIERVVYDLNERPVEYITALYRPDRYKYRMELSRIGDEDTRSWAMAN
jgi:GntR family transcriptional regulator